MDFHDPIAAGTHLGFALWCLLAGAILLRWTRHHPPIHRAAVAVYALSAVTLYTASGLFHSLRYDSEQDPQFEFFRRFDLSAVFGLIAGSCLPIFVYVLPKWWMRACAAMIVGIAATGIALVWAMTEVVTQTVIFVYVGMGLVALIPSLPLYRKVGWRGMAIIFAFGFLYVFGAVVHSLKWPVLVRGWFGYHEILHLADIVATLLHFILLVQFALPYARVARSRHPAATPERAMRRITG